MKKLILCLAAMLAVLPARGADVVGTGGSIAASAFGRTLMNSVDAPAARTTLGAYGSGDSPTFGTESANIFRAVTNGTAAAPAYSFTSTSNTGMYYNGNNGVTVAGAGVAALYAGQDGSGNPRVNLSLNSPLGWGSASPGQTFDAAIKRTGPGALTVTDSTGTADTGRITLGSLYVMTESGQDFRSRFITGRNVGVVTAGQLYLNYNVAAPVQLGNGTVATDLIIANGYLGFGGASPDAKLLRTGAGALTVTDSTGTAGTGSLSVSSLIIWGGGGSNAITRPSTNILQTDVRWRVGQGSVIAPNLSHVTDTDTGINLDGLGSVAIVTDGVAKWNVGSTGHLQAGTDNAYDFGDATHRVKTGYFGTSLGVGITTTPAARVDISEPSVAQPALKIAHATNSDVISVSKTAGLGALINASFTSNQSDGFVFSNTDANTSLLNRYIYGFNSTVSTGADSYGIIGGHFSGIQTRNTAGTNPTGLTSGRPVGIWGEATTTALAPEGYAIYGLASSARVVPLYLRAAASQTSDLIRAENSSLSTLFKVDSAGAVTAAGGLSALSLTSGGFINGPANKGFIDLNAGAGTFAGFGFNGVSTLQATATQLNIAVDAIRIGSATNTFLINDAANTPAFRNGVNPQTLNVYGTYTSGSVYERLSLGYDGTRFRIAAEHTGATQRALLLEGNSVLFRPLTGNNSVAWQMTGSGHLQAVADNTYDFGDATHRARNLYLGGTATVGNILATTSIVAGTGSFSGFLNSTKIRDTSDGVLSLTNSAGTGFTRLQFGGTSSAEPAIKRNGSGIEVTDATGTAGTGTLTVQTLVSPSVTPSSPTVLIRADGTSVSYGSGAATDATRGTAFLAAQTAAAAGDTVKHIVGNIDIGSSQVGKADVRVELGPRVNVKTTAVGYRNGLGVVEHASSYHVANGLQRWRNGIGNVHKRSDGTGYGGVDVVLIGDSISEGGTAGGEINATTTEYMTDTFSHQLKVMLQDRFNPKGVQGGYGFIPVMTGPHVGQWVADANIFSSTGTWTKDGSSTFGLGGRVWQGNPGSNTAYIRMNGGDADAVKKRLNVSSIQWVATQGAILGTARYDVGVGSAPSIGAGSPTGTINMNGGTAYGTHFAQITGLTRTADNYLQIATPSATNGLWLDGVICYDGDYDCGMRLHNLSRWGLNSGAANWQPTTDHIYEAESRFGSNNGGASNAKLVMLDLITNDCAGMTTAQFKANINAWVDGFLGWTSKPAVLIWIPPNMFDHALWYDYVEVLYQVADEHDNVAILDLNRVLAGDLTSATANSFGLIGNHFLDPGQRWLAEQMYRTITKDLDN